MGVTVLRSDLASAASIGEVWRSAQAQWAFTSNPVKLADSMSEGRHQGTSVALLFRLFSTAYNALQWVFWTWKF